MAFTPAGNECCRFDEGLDEGVEGVGWCQDLQSLLLRVMAEERKQGDSVAHDAYCRVEESPVMIEEEEEKKKKEGEQEEDA